MMRGVSSRARALEDLFFRKNDAVLMEKLKELEHMHTTQRTLAEVSGIRNRHILQKLVELEITPDLLASLAAVPLVEVAWADGRVREKERQAVLSGVRGCGICRDSIDFQILDVWLRHRPSRRLLDAWVHYIRGLCESLTEKEREDLKASLLTRARRVAEAAGGFLGLTSPVSREEQAMLDKMARAFEPEE